jgi:hypothetical protein
MEHLNYFLVILGLKTLQYILCLRFLLFFSKDIVHKIVVEMNHCTEHFMNSRGRVFTFKSLVRHWTPVAENKCYVVPGLHVQKGVIQNPILQAYTTPGFGGVISRDRIKS